MKIFKKIFSLFISLCLMMSMCVLASANGIGYTNVYSDDSKMYLVDEKITYEKNCVITERLYSSVDSDSKAASGSGTFKYEKEEQYQTTSVTYYVQGFFTWNSTNDTATVTNVKKGYTAPSGFTIKNQNLASGSNQGATFLFGRKYAYAQYTLTIKDSIGLTRNCSAYVDVNVDGVVSYR